jgi:hypothetical protein
MRSGIDAHRKESTVTNLFSTPNPLLDNLPQYKEPADFAVALDYNPLRGLNPSRLQVEEKLELLVGKKTPLKPTTKALRLAYNIYGMVKSHYRGMNPIHDAVRRAMAEDLYRRDEEFLRADRQLAAGACLLVVKGPTGTAKSVSVWRACVALGDQVFHLPKNDGAGWLKATQIKYLIVPMSHDGSRGGLELNILLAVDELLGTDYATEIPRQYKTIEKIFGRLVKLLRHTLHLGVLVIEELQLDNIVSSHDATTMQLFLLSLANCGIPVVLVGNSHGFSWLSDLSQEARRMAERKMAVFHPCGALDGDDEWESAVFPGIARYYVLDKKPHPDCAAVLKGLCGGIPGIGLPIWCQGQEEALIAKSASLNPGHLKAAFKDETFDDIREYAAGFTDRDPLKLLRWRDKDVDVEFYARRWGFILPARPETSLPEGTSVVRARTKASPQSALRQRETRRANAEKRRETVKKGLSLDDIRASGLVNHNLASLDQLRRAVESQG